MYDIGEAYTYYKKFIYNEERQVLLKRYGLHVAGSVPSIDWELFGAILTGDHGKQGYGSDLTGHEIKSSVERASFEYQYHLHGGKQKLLDDMKVRHIFISYSDDYKNIEVRRMDGKQLKERFRAWLPGLEQNYAEGPGRRQRYRKSIPFGIVKKNGVLIMSVKDGELVETEN